MELLGTEQSPNPSVLHMWWGGVFFPGLVPLNDLVNFESVVGIKPGDSSVVTGYQVDVYP